MLLHGPDDRWRVLLKGQLQDYIHATNINVREDNVNKNINISFIHSLLFLQNCKLVSEKSNKTLSVSLCDLFFHLCSGLQAQECLHHHSRPHGGHMWGLLEDGA